MEEEDEGYRVYRKFFSIVEAESLLEFFKEKGIDYRVNNYNSNIGSTFASANDPNRIEVRLLPSQFEVADKLLELEALNSVNNLPNDYYLFSFSEDELMDILKKPDEWTQEDYVLAQQLLKKKGKVITEQTLQDYKTARLEELRKPQKGNILWIIIGYISALAGGYLGVFLSFYMPLAIRAVLSSGGLLGIYMGWYMRSSKKTLPNGERIYVYDLPTRLAGRTMLILGVICFIGWCIAFMMRYLSI